MTGLGIVLGLSGSSIHVFRQLTHIPPHLAPIPAHTSQDERQRQLDRQALATVRYMHSQPRLADGSVVVYLTSEQLNALWASTLSRQIDTQENHPILTATHVEITDQRFITTVLLDLSHTSASDLQGGDRLSLLRRFLKIPGLKNYPVAIALLGEPTIKERRLVLKNAEIKLGKLHLSLTTASHYLGISPALLEGLLEQEWHTLPIELETVEIQNHPSFPTPVKSLKLTGQLTAW